MTSATRPVLRVTVQPAAEVYDLEEIKQALKVDTDDQDRRIYEMMRRARIVGEKESGRAWLTQTLKLELPCFPSGARLPLPRPPVRSITSIKYYDADGTQQTLAGTVYELVPHYYDPAAVLLPDQEWPTSLQDGKALPVEVVYTAGFGDDADGIDAEYANAFEAYRGGVELLVSHWYYNGMPVLTGKAGEELPRTVTDLFEVDRVIPV